MFEYIHVLWKDFENFALGLLINADELRSQ